MRLSLALFSASMICTLLISSGFLLRADATNWVGWDNGEFDCSNTTTCVPQSSYVYTESVLSSSMTQNTSVVSLQYNPDWDTSKNHQTVNSYLHAEWFQSGIIAYTSGCVKYTYQVYDTVALSQDVSVVTSCQSVTGIFTADSSGDATWSIYEDTDSNGFINELDFGVLGGGSGATSYYYSLYPENVGYWFWLRSNTCLCGAGLIYNVGFLSGTGTMYQGIGVNYNLYSISPPIDRGTGENSNMQYGCWSGSGTRYMSQSFSYNSGHC
jgi:hypothetical protein